MSDSHLYPPSPYPFGEKYIQRVKIIAPFKERSQLHTKWSKDPHKQKGKIFVDDQTTKDHGQAKKFSL